MKFHPDPNNPKEMICDDCFNALEDVKADWQDDDDYGVDDDWFWDDDNDDYDEFDENFSD